MEDRIFNELWNSKCKKDYKSRHFWKSLGIICEGSDKTLIWRCSQCQECISEELSFLSLDEDFFNDRGEEIKEINRIMNYFMGQYDKSIKLNNLSRKKIYNWFYQLHLFGIDKGKKEDGNKKTKE